MSQQDAVSSSEVRGNKAVRFAYLAAGTAFLALGVIGMALPVMPTTPFLILAAGCYARGSTRMHKWLLSNRLFGKVVCDYTQKRGITRRARWISIAILWSTICASILLIGSSPVMVLLLVAVAIGVTIHLMTLRTLTEATV